MVGKGQNKGIEEEAGIVYNAQHADVFMSGVFAGNEAISHVKALIFHP